MDKADILEMAVEYVKKTRDQTEEPHHGTTPTVTVDRYRAGFNACADVLQSHLDQLPQVSNDCRARLMDHLANFIQNKQWFAQHLQNACLPLQFCDTIGQSASPNATTLPGGSERERPHPLATNNRNSTSPVVDHPAMSNSARLSLGSDCLSPHSDGMFSGSDRLSSGSSRMSSGSSRMSMDSNRSSLGSDLSGRLSLGSGFTSPDSDRRSSSGRLSSGSDRLSLGSDNLLHDPLNINTTSLKQDPASFDKQIQYCPSAVTLQKSEFSGLSTFSPPPAYNHNDSSRQKSTRSCTITSSQAFPVSDSEGPIDLSNPRRALTNTNNQCRKTEQMINSTDEHNLHVNVTQRKRLKCSTSGYRTSSVEHEDLGSRKIPQSRAEMNMQYLKREYNKENNILVVQPHNAQHDIDDEDDDSMWRPW